MTKWTSSWAILILRTSRRSWQPPGRTARSIQRSLQHFCAQWGSRPRNKSVGDTMFGIPGPLLSGIPLSASGRTVPAQRGAPKSVQKSSFYIESFNGSCWKTLRRRLAETDAVVLCAQELGISE
eukprot:7555541-Pyramimonas_sp.AAC.1